MSTTPTKRDPLYDPPEPASESELYLAGCLVKEPALADLLLAEVDDDQFTDLDLRAIFTAARELRAAGLEVEPAALQPILKRLDAWQPDRLAVAVEAAGSTLNWQFHAAQVRDAAERRAAWLAAMQTLHAAHGGEAQGATWPEPQPVPSDLPAVQPFDLALLPESFRGWVSDSSERMQCVPDYPAVAAMVSLAAIVGRRCTIRPKRRDDWQVVPNLWGACVGRPGILKTPAMEEALRPLTRLEIAAKEEHTQLLREHEAATVVRKIAKQEAEAAIRKDLKAGHSAESIAKRLASEQADEQPPQRKRYRTSDCTVEKLGEILNANPAGVLVFRDELTGFLRTLDKDGHEADRAFFLEAWNGNGRFTFDRIGRGTIDVEACCVSLLGAIQPGPLAEYIRHATHGGGGDDGFVQRFQLLVHPDPPATWRNIDRWPDPQAKQVAWERFEQLAAATFEHAERDDAGQPYLRFDHEAQRRFDDWRADLEARLRAGDLHAALESHLAKYRSLVPSLALLIELAERPDAPRVSGEALERSIRWAEYLETHGRRIYATATDGGATSARALLRKLEAGELRSPFALRDVYRQHWTHLTTRDDAQAAVDLLEDLGWLRSSTEATAGRAKTTYAAHPKTLPHAGRGSAKSDKSPPEPPSGTFVTSLPGESHGKAIPEPATAAPSDPAPKSFDGAARGTEEDTTEVSSPESAVDPFDEAYAADSVGDLGDDWESFAAEGAA